jgi:hypothetical protein
MRDITRRTSVHLTPAEYIIKVFGGVRKTARAIGRSPSSVVRWKSPAHVGGTGGDIPDAAKRRILLVAKEQKIDINLEDLFYGRTIRSKRRS